MDQRYNRSRSLLAGYETDISKKKKANISKRGKHTSDVVVFIFTFCFVFSRANKAIVEETEWINWWVCCCCCIQEADHAPLIFCTQENGKSEMST